MTSHDDDALPSDVILSLLFEIELAEIRRTMLEGWAMFQFSVGFLHSMEELLAGMQRAGRPPMLNGVPVRLSGREAEVLRLVAQGLHNHEVGKRLHISGGTVKNHLTAILSKLQARSRWEAVLRAQTLGLL